MAQDDDYVRSTCKIGQGAACCRYLLMDLAGWNCAKTVADGGTVRALLDKRVALGTINARGDNCEGIKRLAN